MSSHPVRKVICEAHPTDAGNADRIVAAAGSKLRYNHDSRQWHYYDGKAWAPDKRGRAHRLAHNTAKLVLKAAAELPAGEERDKLWKHGNKFEDSRALDRALKVAQSHPEMASRTEDFDQDLWALNMQNGILDLRTLELRPHDPAEMHSKITGASYEPGAECPRWQAFIEWALPDADVRWYFQKLCGYTLTGDVGEQLLPFAHGEGGNGKSTALTVLRKVMGDYAFEAPPSLLVARRGDDEHSTVIASLQGHRLVTVQETEEGKRMATAIMKRITGEEELTARRLYRDFEAFRNVTKLWYSANHKPEVDGLDEAIWRRMRLLPFDQQVADEDRDTSIGDKLAEELDGVLGWMVDGLRGYHDEGLAPPAAVIIATDAYRTESNPLQEWVDAEGALDPQAEAPAQELREAYEAWAQRWHRRKVKTGKAWGAALRDLGCTSEKTTAGNLVWVGIRLLEYGEQQPAI